jgi:hypothetical protein
MRKRDSLLVRLTLAVMVLLAVPAGAQMFTVTLENGHSFDSRYRPRQVGEDAGKIAVLTDVGNWIYLAKEDVESITSDMESRGFGVQLDTSTVALGWAPNDKPQPQEGEEQAPDAAARLLSYLQDQDDSRPVYNVQQFVNTEDAGMGTAGFPASFGNPFAGAGRE